MKDTFYNDQNVIKEAIDDSLKTDSDVKSSDEESSNDTCSDFNKKSSEDSI